MAQQRRQQQATQHAPAANDWEGVESADLADSGYGGGIVPEGWYDVEVLKAAIRNSNSSGLDYPNLDLQIMGGDYSGRHAFCGLYINSNADTFRRGQKAFLARWFEVCAGEIPTELPATDDDLAPLVAAHASVYVIVEDNKDLQGNMVQTNRVVRVRPIGEEQTAPRTTRAQGSTQTAQRQQAQPQTSARTGASRTGTNGARQGQPARAQQGQRRPAQGGAFNDMNDDIPF